MMEVMTYIHKFLKDHQVRNPSILVTSGYVSEIADSAACLTLSSTMSLSSTYTAIVAVVLPEARLDRDADATYWHRRWLLAAGVRAEVLHYRHVGRWSEWGAYAKALLLSQENASKKQTPRSVFSALYIRFTTLPSRAHILPKFMLNNSGVTRMSVMRQEVSSETSTLFRNFYVNTNVFCTCI